MSTKLVVGADGSQSYVNTTSEEDAQALIDAAAAQTSQQAAQVLVDRQANLIGDATLKAFIQTLKGFHTPADVQNYWNGLSAVQKTNAIFVLVLYVASKE